LSSAILIFLLTRKQCLDKVKEIIEESEEEVKIHDLARKKKSLYQVEFLYFTLQGPRVNILASVQASDQAVIAKQSFTLSKYFYHYVTHCKIVVKIV